MLSTIQIRNFAIISQLDLDWQAGMCVITGETGAGKSIVIDALGLALGERAEQSMIKAGAKQAEVTALFELNENAEARRWLSTNDLIDDAENAESTVECILRRVIVREGRTKAYINGRSVTQSQLKQVGHYLVDIHGQHAHQNLLKNSQQLNLLDRFANHDDLLSNVQHAYQQLNKIQIRQTALQQAKSERDAKRELLTYQVEELSESDPQASVLESLEQQHKVAATSQDRQLLTQEILSTLANSEVQSSLSQLQLSIEQTNRLISLDPQLASLTETLTDAENLIQEAVSELKSYESGLDCDPAHLAELDAKLGQFHDLARKHHVSIENLPEHFEKLSAELQQLQADDSELEVIEQEFQDALKIYQQQADILSKSRSNTAKQLEKQVSQSIQQLAMEGGKFAIKMTPKKSNYSAGGLEDVEFLVSANPGQPLQPLNKVASGGELSRISLAISVITSKQQLVPCIIFDEVDVGIGGGTAETVGQLLKQLGQDRQVICVTHQPQVAACGDHHLIASKTKLTNDTQTQVNALSKDERIEELARMLGGKVISDNSRVHAREMLGL